MARKRYSVPLKLVARADEAGNYYAPDTDVTDFYVRHFDTVGMTCKIEVEDTETVSTGTEITEAVWNDSEA